MLKSVKRLQNGESFCVICLGDSITEQNFHTHGKLNYVGQLTEWFMYAFGRRSIFINTGSSGKSSWDIKRSIGEQCARFKPGLATLMIGVNDALKGRSLLDEFTANLEAIHETLEENKCELIMLTPNRINVSLDSPEVVQRRDLPYYVETMRKISLARGIKLCDINLEWENLSKLYPWQHWTMMNDPLHPNERGHDFMAAIIKKYISEQNNIGKVWDTNTGLVFWE